MSVARSNDADCRSQLIKADKFSLFSHACVQAKFLGLKTRFSLPFAAQVLKRLTSSVSCALDEAAAALTRMRSDPPGGGAGGGGGATGGSGGAPTSGSASAASSAGTADSERSLVEACNEGDINKVGT